MWRTIGTPGTRPGTGEPSLVTITPEKITSACWQPLANGHRPVTLRPPSTCSARPCGAADPATIRSGPKRSNSASNVARGRRDRNGTEPAPIIATQPSEPSTCASAVRISSVSGKSSSSPPTLLGAYMRNTPRSFSVCTTSSGMRRPASNSGARAASPGPRARISSIIAAAASFGMVFSPSADRLYAGGAAADHIATHMATKPSSALASEAGMEKNGEWSLSSVATAFTPAAWCIRRCTPMVRAWSCRHSM